MLMNSLDMLDIGKVQIANVCESTKSVLMNSLDMLDIGKVQIANVCESTKSDPELNITDSF